MWAKMKSTKNVFAKSGIGNFFSLNFFSTNYLEREREKKKKNPAIRGKALGGETNASGFLKSEVWHTLLDLFWTWKQQTNALHTFLPTSRNKNEEEEMSKEEERQEEKEILDK